MGSQAAGLPGALAMMVTTQTAAGWPLDSLGSVHRGKGRGSCVWGRHPQQVGIMNDCH